MNNMSKKQEIIGLIDADLLDNGTRHPNLVLLKLAGFFHDNGIPFELILDPQANTLHYTRIYLSCVFTFTKLPELYIRSKGTPEEKKFKCGGTGFYANEAFPGHGSPDNSPDRRKAYHFLTGGFSKLQFYILT